jgi:hypothetical protein
MSWLGIDLRRMGTGLLVFGVVGMIVAGIVAVGLAAGAISARNLDERVAADQARLVTTLERVDATMARTVTTIGNAGTTLTTTSETIGSAGDVLGRVADTSDELSQSLDVSILGSRPLQGAATRFGQLAVDARAFQDKADALATNLGVNAGDTAALADSIEDLRTELATLQSRVSSFEVTGQLVSYLVGGILLLSLLTAWLAVAGAGCAWFGYRLRRLGSEVAAAPPRNMPPTPGPR